MNNIRIALIAHDGKKADMVSFVHAGLQKVRTMFSGPMGGDAQIASMIVNKEVDVVIFFIDPLEVHPHQVDVSMLLRICNVHDIPLATNYSTASRLIDCIVI
jgi:methylglyoxal synthase